jgi:hypothetical protein
MIPFPTQCPACHQKGIAYSVGVIRNRTVVQFREYPVVRCKRCAADFFTRPPDFTRWTTCTTSGVIAFTTDPEAIEKDIKLDYDFKLVGGVEIYSVYPTSGSAGTAV